MRDDSARPADPAPPEHPPGWAASSPHDGHRAPGVFPPPPAGPPDGPPTELPAEPGEQRSRRRRWTAWWYSRTVRAAAIAGLLTLSGVAILLIVRAETGTEGFLIGLLLAVVPVPLLLWAFRWLDRIEPTPWRSLGFAFAWGACASTLVAVVANTFATRWLTTSVFTNPDTDADIVGAVLVAPVTEEVAKGAALLLLFLYRPRQFTGLLSGIVLAGVVATGFAFTENILYLGSAYGEDQELGVTGVSVTAATFFVRILMSPFAHPLFTIMAGLGFGLAATRAPERRVARVVLPLLGLLLAIGLHALWNGTASLSGYHFLAAYALLMAPLCAGLVWLAIWQRRKLLRTVRAVLPHYAAQGWFTQAEAYGLGATRTRWVARDVARRERGGSAGRIVADYHRTATALALLRDRARRLPTQEFSQRERRLLDRLLELRPIGSPYTTRASQPRLLYYAPYYQQHPRPYPPQPYVGTPYGPPTYGPPTHGPPTYGTAAHAYPPYGQQPYGPYPPPPHGPPTYAPAQPPPTPPSAPPDAPPSTPPGNAAPGADEEVRPDD